MAVCCFDVLDYLLKFGLFGAIPDIFSVTPFFPERHKAIGGGKWYLSCDGSNKLSAHTKWFVFSEFYAIPRIIQLSLIKLSGVYCIYIHNTIVTSRGNRL